MFISPEELHVPSYIIDEVVKPSGCEYKEVRTMDEVLPELDVLYMTRVQRERFFNEEDYIRLKDSFILDAEKMKLAPKDLIVLHPLPRVNEIAVEVDDDPRAKYFVQAQNGVYVRMALILMLLNIEPGLFLRRKPYAEHRQYPKRHCDRPYSGRQGYAHLELLELDKLDCCVALIKMPAAASWAEKISSRLKATSPSTSMCSALSITTSPYAPLKTVSL